MKLKLLPFLVAVFPNFLLAQAFDSGVITLGDVEEFWAVTSLANQEAFCSELYASGLDTLLPDIITLPPNEELTDSLSKLYNCRYQSEDVYSGPENQNIFVTKAPFSEAVEVEAGLNAYSIVGSDFESFGQVERVAVGSGGDELFIVGRKADNFGQPEAEVFVDPETILYMDSFKILLTEDPRPLTMRQAALIGLLPDFQEQEQIADASFSSDGRGFITSFFMPRNRSAVRVTSEPSNAKIFRTSDGRNAKSAHIGETGMDLILREDVLESLVISLEGFEDCNHKTAVFSPSAYGSTATLHCELEPVD